MLTRRTVLKGVAAASVAALVVTLPQEESPVVWDTNDWRDGMPVRDDKLDALRYEARYLTGPRLRNNWYVHRHNVIHSTPVR